AEVDGVEQVGGEGVGGGADDLAWVVGDRAGPRAARIGVEQVGGRGGGDRAELVAAVLVGDFEPGDQVVPQRAGRELGEEVALVEQDVVHRVARLGLRVDQRAA